MSTEVFIRCLKRFSARRGIPHKFLSDNGKTFKASAKFIKAVFKEDLINEYLAGKGYEWLFNIERAPWWGGAFKRMVKSTKRCLKKMIGRATLSHDELLTAVTEIESIINSRPLSYIAADDIEEPLTPSHLLIGHRVLNLPDYLNYSCDIGDEDFTLNSKQLEKRMKHLNSILNHFWRRWRSEYLTELRESHRQLAKRARVSDGMQISVGDVVVVHEEGVPRGFWKLGRIEKLITGRDGQTRGAAVRVAIKGRQHTSLNRPLQHLYPLEVHGIDPSGRPANELQQIPSQGPPQEDISTSYRSRPQRSSAKKCDIERRAWIREEEEREMNADN